MDEAYIIGFILNKLEHSKKAILKYGRLLKHEEQDTNEAICELFAANNSLLQAQNVLASFYSYKLDEGS